MPHTKPCIVLPMMSPPQVQRREGAKKAHRNVSDSSENKREREIGAGFNYYPHSRCIAVLKLAPHTTSGTCPLVLYAATLHTIPCYYVTRSRVPTGTSLSQNIKNSGGDGRNRTSVLVGSRITTSLTRSSPDRERRDLTPPELDPIV